MNQFAWETLGVCLTSAILLCAGCDDSSIVWDLDQGQSSAVTPSQK